MVLKAPSNMETSIRLALKEAATSIDDIAENLLQNWKPAKKKRSSGEEQKTGPVLEGVVKILNMV
jgi:hypothetical protein